MQPKWEVADVLRNTDISGFPVHQQKTLRAIGYCRTAALGGHIDACDDCGTIHISYNSCRNRHCPKCQGHKREEWIQQQKNALLPCTYYHVVFTLPHELNPLAIYKPSLVYNTLFECVWKTLNQFGLQAGMQMGMTCILHTWGQTLSLHPHLHCIVPGGGIDEKGCWRKKLRTNKYLFSTKALSKVFRAKYVAALRAADIEDKALIESLFQKEWVVYAKRPFGGPQQVIEYLGRYSHKVAISNHRIENVTNQTTTFRYKDYNKGGNVNTMELTNDEFTRRFSMHILPQRFVRIRHYGILSSSWKRGKLQALQQSLKVKPPINVVKTHLHKCPCCKTGILITIEVFGKRGPPEKYFTDKHSCTR